MLAGDARESVPIAPGQVGRVVALNITYGMTRWRKRLGETEPPIHL